jgi:hypothetical protein
MGGVEELRELSASGHSGKFIKFADFHKNSRLGHLGHAPITLGFPVFSGHTHQNLRWMTGLKRGDAEGAKDFAETQWMDCHGTTVIFIINPTKPSKLSAFLCELRVSAFR